MAFFIHRMITQPGRLTRGAWLVVLASLAVSCATMIRPPANFLRTDNGATGQWLNTVVDVDIAETRIVYLPLTDAFAGMKLAIGRADAPIESLKIALHAHRITRRQALWLLAEKYGLNVSIERVRGQPPYFGISRK